MDYLAHLEHELDTFASLLDGDLSAPVQHCGEWTVFDLAEHVARGSLWCAFAVTDQRPDFDAPRAPRDDLAPWFRDSTAHLLSVLSRDPSSPAWTFFPPNNVGFWRRRRTMESLVHRWDAENALGIVSSINPVVAGDGVTEVIDTIAPRQIDTGRATPPAAAVRFTASDLDSSWVFGPGDPVATISGSAADLLLMLWERLPYDHPGLTWDGDLAAARTVLKGPLTA